MIILQAIQKGFEIGITAFFALVALALCCGVALVVIARVGNIFGKHDDSA